MGTLTLLVRRNLRRGRLPLAVIALLSAIACALATVGLMCALRYPQMFDESAERLNAPDVQAITLADRRGTAEKALRSDPRVGTIESSEVMVEFANLPLTDFSMDTVIVYLDLDRPTTLGRTVVEERRDDQYPNPVYLPQILRSAGAAAVGDRITLASGQVTRHYTVAGFFENLSLGTTTMGSMALGLPADEYRALAASPTAPQRDVLVQATVMPADEAADVSGALGEQLHRPGDTLLSTWIGNLTLLREAVLPGPSTYAASLVAFSGNVVLVIIMIIWFWIRSAIDQDLASLGVLSASGVGHRTVRTALVLAPVVAVGAGALLGIAASGLLAPQVADSLASQTGLNWQPGLDPAAAALVLGAALVVPALLGLAATRRVPRLRPVEALSGGQAAHSFRRSWWPLATSRGPLHHLLGLKTALAHPGSSLMVSITMAVVCLSAIFSATLTTNVLDNRQAFTRNLIGEIGDVTSQLRPGVDREAVRDEVSRLPGVERAYYMDYLQGSVAGRQSAFVVTDDFGQQAHSSVHTGREPRHPNEVAVGSQVLQATGLAIGQEIRLDFGARSARYVVVGELSTIQYGGFRVDLTTDGYRRLVPGHQLSDLEVLGTPDADLDALAQAIRGLDSKPFRSVQNQRESIDSQLGVYMRMIGQLANGVLAVSVVVTVLVLALMTTTMLRRQRAGLGVLSAMGHSRRQLLAQVLASHLPLVLLGSVLGTALGLAMVPRLLTSALGSLGISRFDVTTSVGLVSLLVGLLVLCATLITMAAAWPVLRRRPVELLG